MRDWLIDELFIAFGLFKPDRLSVRAWLFAKAYDALRDLLRWMEQRSLLPGSKYVTRVRQLQPLEHYLLEQQLKELE